MTIGKGGRIRSGPKIGQAGTITGAHGLFKKRHGDSLAQFPMGRTLSGYYPTTTSTTSTTTTSTTLPPVNMFTDNFDDLSKWDSFGNGQEAVAGPFPDSDGNCLHITTPDGFVEKVLSPPATEILITGIISIPELSRGTLFQFRKNGSPVALLKFDVMIGAPLLWFYSGNFIHAWENSVNVPAMGTPVIQIRFIPHPTDGLLDVTLDGEVVLHHEGETCIEETDVDAIRIGAGEGDVGESCQFFLDNLEVDWNY